MVRWKRSSRTSSYSSTIRQSRCDRRDFPSGTYPEGRRRHGRDGRARRVHPSRRGCARRHPFGPGDRHGTAHRRTPSVHRRDKGDARRSSFLRGLSGGHLGPQVLAGIFSACQAKASALASPAASFPPRPPLRDLLRHAARRSGFHDSRFPAISEYELLELREAAGPSRRIFLVKLRFNPDNIMKTVSAIHAFAALRDVATVLKTVPDFERLYEDAFYPEVEYT